MASTTFDPTRCDSFFMGSDQRGSGPIKTNNTDGLRLRIFDIFAAVRLDFLRKSVESLSSRLQKCVQDAA